MFITMGTHCDLFWMGTHNECLERGTAIQRQALNLMEQHPKYCYYIETTVFADYHLRKYPEDKARMQRLMERGQLEVGASFVDRIEHVHHGESLIRQAVEGVRWLHETFGPGPRTACHPDLPGMSPQVPQIYAQAGVSCYLHARESSRRLIHPLLQPVRLRRQVDQWTGTARFLAAHPIQLRGPQLAEPEPRFP